MIELKEYMEMVAEFHKKDGRAADRKYSCVEDFILQNGREMELGTTEVERGEMKACFQNAYHLAMEKDWTYCEGYAIAKGLIPILHAWVLDGEGKVVDPTWEGEAEYFGCEFPWKWVMGITFKREYWGSMLDDWQNHFPLLTGEQTYPIEEVS